MSSRICSAAIGLATFAMAASASAQTYNGVKAWRISNDKVSLIVTPGGGHIASLTLNRGKGANVNPLWLPPWKSIDPGKWTANPAAYAGKPAAPLLSTILGHNLCLDFFGAPSKAEAALGIPVHGEAPAVAWKLASKSSAGITYSAHLPHAQMNVTRRIDMKSGSSALWITETVENLSYLDRPIGWTQHVTLGPPFLKKGNSFFDLSAGWTMVYPKEFSKDERLQRGSESEWPNATSSDGESVDLRDYPTAKKNSDFTASLVPADRKWAYFTAVNTKLGVMIGYVWPRKDWPWIANWEENHSRAGIPWRGKGVARGMEFGTSPWPDSRREQVTAGTLHGTPMYRWISARATQKVGYGAFVIPVPAGTTGSEDVQVVGNTITVKLAGVEKTVSLAVKR